MVLQPLEPEHNALHYDEYLDLVGWVCRSFDQVEGLVEVVLDLGVAQVYQAQMGTLRRAWEVVGIGCNDSSFLVSTVLLAGEAYIAGGNGDEEGWHKAQAEGGIARAVN